MQQVFVYYIFVFYVPVGLACGYLELGKMCKPMTAENQHAAAHLIRYSGQC